MKKGIAILSSLAAAAALAFFTGCSTAGNNGQGATYINNEPRSSVPFPDSPAGSTDVSPIPPPAGQGNQPDRPPQ